MAVGALEVLMTGYRAVQWAVGNGIKDGVVRMEVENGATHHVLSVRPPKDAAFDLNGVADLDALMKKGRVEWDGTRLRILLPVRRQD